MAKYLFSGSYTTQGVKGLLKDGGSGRKAAVEALVKGLGGSLEAMYYAFGSDDFFIIVNLPDHASASAISLTVAASGAVNVKTTVLMPVEEIDAAVQKTVNYRPPGG